VITNHERIGKGAGPAQEGLPPFVERKVRAQYLDPTDWAVRLAQLPDFFLDFALGGRVGGR
jgi:hypothetical protein